MERVTATEIVLKLHSIWNSGEMGDLTSVYSENFVAHFPGSSEVPERRGLDGVRFGINRIRGAFPDWYEDVQDILVDGNKVATRYISTGTHLGSFWGVPPTGRTIRIDEMSIYRFEGGRIAEQWCLVDELARLNQLGVDLPLP